MSMVRQAHLPGNYELYDASTGVVGPSVCKGCWEEGGVVTSDSLVTAWVSFGSRPQVWWLCRDHAETAKAGSLGMRLLKVQEGISSRPAI